jgi:hypothetical protein
MPSAWQVRLDRYSAAGTPSVDRLLECGRIGNTQLIDPGNYSRDVLRESPHLLTRKLQSLRTKLIDAESNLSRSISVDVGWKCERLQVLKTLSFPQLRT